MMTQRSSMFSCRLEEENEASDIFAQAVEKLCPEPSRNRRLLHPYNISFDDEESHDINVPYFSQTMFPASLSELCRLRPGSHPPRFMGKGRSGRVPCLCSTSTAISGCGVARKPQLPRSNLIRKMPIRSSLSAIYGGIDEAGAALTIGGGHCLYYIPYNILWQFALKYLSNNESFFSVPISSEFPIADFLYRHDDFRFEVIAEAGGTTEICKSPQRRNSR
ncbi:hypothetical protein TNCV_2164901 [Trichonephila clavipes]|nr:hypothetical protein TNCV_2164901 [Trichonephila clavipes]